MNNDSSAPKTQFWIGVGVLVAAGLIHRAVQLWILWPQLAVTINLMANNQIMQLLPETIMREHPWWGLWFLQQSPPLPNLLWAGVLALTDSPLNIAIILILFQALLSCFTAAAMALLLERVGLTWWLALLLSALFFLGSDLMLLEYHTMGQFYYELLTMVLCVASCHAALNLVRQARLRSALGLGWCVAALALTRATFSYFWPLVLVWLAWMGFWRRPKILATFLVPVLLLHGGWSLKAFWVHGYWSWSTSSWGGANLKQGEHNRNGLVFDQWLSRQPKTCASPWHELTVNPPPYFFLMPEGWGSTVPPEVVARDRYIDGLRGDHAFLDSVAAREWCHCLLQEFFRYWLSHPGVAIQGAGRSYKIFWLPIREFHVEQANPLKPEMERYSEGIHWLQGLRGAWQEWKKGYRIRQVPIRFEVPKASDFVPARVIALPFFSSAISELNFALLHSLPLLLLVSWRRKVDMHWPEGFSFLIVIYCYVAGLSSLIEYGENMRFRIEVEPIIWVMSAVIAWRWVLLCREGWTKALPTRTCSLPIRRVDGRLYRIGEGSCRTPK